MKISGMMSSKLLFLSRTPLRSVVNLFRRGGITCLKRPYCSKSSDKVPGRGDSDTKASQNQGQGNSERPVFKPDDIKDVEAEDLGPPTTCCRSGCANCVWLEYVEKLQMKYTDAMTEERIRKELLEIDDPSLRAFIELELRSKGLLKK